MTLTDNATLDLTEFEFEIPCEDDECESPSAWIVHYTPSPCGCANHWKELRCTNCANALIRIMDKYVECVHCDTRVGKLRDLILSITPIKPGGAA